MCLCGMLETSERLSCVCAREGESRAYAVECALSAYTGYVVGKRCIIQDWPRKGFTVAARSVVGVRGGQVQTFCGLHAALCVLCEQSVAQEGVMIDKCLQMLRSALPLFSPAHVLCCVPQFPYQEHYDLVQEHLRLIAAASGADPNSTSALAGSKAGSAMPVDEEWSEGEEDGMAVDK
jgi:hypothetical protein